MKKNKLFLVLTLGACLCGAYTTNLEARHHKTPGEKVDDAIDYSKDKLDKAKEKVLDGIENAKDKTKKGIDKINSKG